MGLAASQVRLLMLTGRKDDVEASLMGLANDKLSLGRKSASASKEYSNALNATKLVWQDGSTNGTNLTYNTLMQYGAATENSGQYMLADNYGRAILNDSYADMLGGSNVNGGKTPVIGLDAFLVKMGIAKDATEAASYIKGYKPEVGSVGSTESADTSGQIKYTDKDIFDELANNYTFTDPLSKKKVNYDSDPDKGYSVRVNTGSFNGNVASLRGLVSEVCDSVGGALSSVLDLKDTKFQDAIDKATSKTQDFYRARYDERGKGDNPWSGSNKITTSWVGPILCELVDVKQMVKTFLCFFDQEYGITNSGNIGTGVNFDNYSTTRTGTTDNTAPTTPQTGRGSGVSGGNSVLPNQTQADFYINMYDYISKNGWTRSSSIDKSDGAYLQNQMSNGNVHLCKFAGDPDTSNNIVESSWEIVSTSGEESLISREADDAKAAKAKSKYEATKDELDYKESMIDMQVTNLDTERSAIDTEIDSVKSILNKNIERGFKLFQNG